MDQFHDIIETSETVPLLVWWQWALLAIAALLVIFILSYWLKRTKSSQKKNNSNLAVALDRIEQINLAETNSNQLATDLSVIVREYLQKQFKDNALFETDEEFHERSQQLESLPPQAAEKLCNYLQDLSRHKYSPNHNHPKALEDFLSKASDLLKGIDSTVPRPLTSG